MNRLMTFDKYRVFETEFAGRPLKVETGKMTQLANGACLVHYGDTTVHVAVTASPKPREGVDFFPLSVDYEEKMYAVGKIPGAYLKREGRPSEKAILTSRVIDRPIRPLFDKSMRNDVSIVCTVMSVDLDCSPEITAMIGASIAISISDVPWNGPISGCSVGMIDGEYIINPTEAQRAVSKMATTVASTSTRIAMIEAGANCVSDDDMYNAIMAGHEANQKIISFIEEIKAEIGKPKFEFASLEPDHDMFEAIKAFAEEDVKVALDTDDKTVRDERLKPIYEAVHAKFDEIYPDSEALIDECLYKTQKFVVGCLTSRSVLTAEVWMIFVRSQQKFLYFREFTVRVCLQEDRHRFLQSLLSALYLTSSCLTVLTAKQRSVTFTTITSRAIQ